MTIRTRRLQLSPLSGHRVFTPRRFLSIAFASLLFPLCLESASAQASAPWRYDLKPGDHLTYVYTVHRHTGDEGSETEVEARYRTHVLVASEESGRVLVGFQRNRESADLLAYQNKGKDRLKQERPGFLKRLQARPTHFSEAMQISLTGEPFYPWEMARESPSHILGALHEIMSLPPVAVRQGEYWRGNNLLNLDFRWTKDEALHGKSCHRAEGASPDGSIRLTYWFCPESGVLEQVELEGTYPVFGGKTHEIARMELESRARGENIDTWLGSPETRLGILEALLLGTTPAVSAGQLSKPLASDDRRAQGLALAVASRRKISVAKEDLERLQNSPSEAVQTLARELLNPAENQPALDDCKRPIAPKAPPEKLGTTLQAVAGAGKTPEIPYFLRIPLTYEGSKPAPLLIYLSGSAGFAIDGVNSAEDVVADTNYLVLYPHAGEYWWKPEVASRVAAVLDDVLQHYNVDRDRIYLAGFSNGGTGALYLASLWPQRFAAVVSLMGAGQCNELIKQGLANLKNLPILFVHGEKDPLISAECSTVTYNAINELAPAIKPELKMLPQREHDITLQSDDGLTLAYLKNKVRNPFPKRVDMALFDGLAARGYWVEIVDGQPGKSEVQARAKSDNTIEIHSQNVRRLRLYLRPELVAKQGDLRVEWNGKKLITDTRSHVTGEDARRSTAASELPDVCSLPAPASGDGKLDRADIHEFSLP